jgi:dihydroxyacetone kinase-like predicted kinase
VRLFEGAQSHSVRRAPAVAANVPPVPRATVVPDADDGFGYETMFLLEPLGGARLDVEAIRTSLQAMGESVLVAGDGSAVKVHVHSQGPDEIVAFGLAQGSLTRLSVENLDREVQDVRERRAAEFTASTQDQGITRAEPPAPVALGVISVVAGDGLAAVVRSLGASGIVSGGQGVPTRAPASSSPRSNRRTRTRSSCCPTTPTSCWRRARWPG